MSSCMMHCHLMLRRPQRMRYCSCSRRLGWAVVENDQNYPRVKSDNIVTTLSQHCHNIVMTFMGLSRLRWKSSFFTLLKLALHMARSLDPCAMSLGSLPVQLSLFNGHCFGNSFCRWYQNVSECFFLPHILADKPHSGRSNRPP